VDVSNAGQIGDELLSVINRGARVLIADMTATASCDHAGAGAVVRAYQRGVTGGTELRLVVTAQIVSRVLSISGVDRLVSIYPSLEAATAAQPAAAALAPVAAPAGTGTNGQPPPHPAGRAGRLAPAAGPADGHPGKQHPGVIGELAGPLPDGGALAGGRTLGERRRGMGGSEVRQRARPPQRAGGPVFDLVVSKLRRPSLRPGTVRRLSLIERLARGDARPVVLVVAPPGYGKTTLLSQWAERNGQAFAWVSVDEADNDPKVLLSYIAAALDAVEPIDGRVFDALASPASSVPGSVVPRLGSALASMTSPVVLVLDDVHLLHNSECRAALSVLADHVPAGSRLALAGRAGPPLRTARQRAEGKIIEIGPRDLSLTREEASSLLRNVDLTLAEEDVAELHRRTEGWPAGLYLAALCLREGGPLAGAAVSFGGDDRLVSEYMKAEFLSRISARQRLFLTRTAVLERLCGPLCDAVLDAGGSAAILADLAGSNMLLVPLDRRGQWYRYHHLFRDMLLAELHRVEPGLMPVLRRRAVGWCLDNGMPEEALEYTMAAGDVDGAARLVGQLTVPVYRKGRVTTIQRWYRWLEDRGGIEGHPMTAVLASLFSALTGRPAEAERWADAVDRWQYGDPARPDDPSAKAWAALLRAILCRHGAEQMRADADEAVRRFAAETFVTPAPALLQGIARVLCGDPNGGDSSLQDAVRVGEQAGAPHDLAVALCEQALLAMAHSQWDQAEVLAEKARTVLRQAGLEESYATPLICALRARAALHRADVPAARRQLVSAQRLRPLLTYALPHFAVQARIELARVHLALADQAGARTLMREVDDVLRRRPGLGTLAGEAGALRAQLASQRGSSAPGASALTAAELRLLPLLSTHLSFPEIAAEMFLSRHTIKSQANAIYRKLGASSRSQAVARSRELGLLAG
jgi:LuxR family transcriptional regulator, maltose regulon positive regulatory protein